MMGYHLKNDNRKAMELPEMPDGDVEIAKRGMGILYGDDFAKSEADNAVG